MKTPGGHARRRIMAFKNSIASVLAFGLLTVAPAWAQQPGANFPDGPGKDTVVAVCNGCHDINRVRAGYTPAGWNMLQHMMQNMGAPVPPEDWPTVTTYLTKNFPEDRKSTRLNSSDPSISYAVFCLKKKKKKTKNNSSTKTHT